MASFSQHATLFRPLVRRGYSTQTHRPPYMPTDCQHSLHTHTRLPTTMELILWLRDAATVWGSWGNVHRCVFAADYVWNAVTSETKPQKKKHFKLLNNLCAPHPGGRRRVKISFKLTEGTRMCLVRNKVWTFSRSLVWCVETFGDFWPCYSLICATCELRLFHGPLIGSSTQHPCVYGVGMCTSIWVLHLDIITIYRIFLSSKTDVHSGT